MNRWKPPMSMWLQKCYFPLLLPFDFGKLLPLSFLNFLYTSYTEPKPHTHKGRKRPLKNGRHKFLVMGYNRLKFSNV